MNSAEIKNLLDQVTLGGEPLGHLEHDKETQTWWTTALLEFEEEGNITLDLEFQHTSAAEDLAHDYLTVIWAVVANDEMMEQPDDDSELLELLNRINSIPGGKFRVHWDEDGAGSVVCEADVILQDTTAESLSRVTERTMELVAGYYHEIRDVIGGFTDEA